MTLFNLRTGYWIDNPKHVIQKKQREALIKAAAKSASSETSPVEHTGKWIKKVYYKAQNWWETWRLKHPLWLRYILRELTGNLSSNTAKVNVSDGGHTGDNLGLLPLIQRRCSTIVVADFEADLRTLEELRQS